MKRKIIVLGSKGMLGQMVNSFFRKKGYDIITFDKRFDEESIQTYVQELNDLEASVVINCIGRIKQKSDSAYELFMSNTLFPLELARSLKLEHLLIHPSTDCVFDGNTITPYFSFQKHTAQDVYGISKSMGETAVMARPHSLVFRVSIIGPDKYSNKGLLSWFLNNKPSSELYGYTNHFWNGITTLEWSEKLHYFLQDPALINNLLKRNYIQFGTEEIYTKYDMLFLFNKYFKKGFKVNPIEAGIGINRCLMAEIISKSLEEQLSELSVYMEENSFY